MTPITEEQYMYLHSSRRVMGSRSKYHAELSDFISSGEKAAELDTFGLDAKDARCSYASFIKRFEFPVEIIMRRGHIYAIRLDTDVQSEQKITWQRRLAAAVCGGEYEFPSDIEETAESLVSVLPGIGKEVIIMRFRDCMSLEKIGNRFGVTRERIRQIEAKSLRILRHPKYISAWKLGLTEANRIREERRLQNERLLQERKEEAEAEKNRIREKIMAEGNRYALPLSELDLTVRSYNVLMKNGIESISQLYEKKFLFEKESDFHEWLLSLSGIGRASVEDIEEKMKTFVKKGIEAA